MNRMRKDVDSFMADINTVKAIGGVVVSAAKELIKDEEVVKFVCGTYADGDGRSVVDAVKGEYISPKQKKKLTDNSCKKKSKKNKKNKKKKNKKKGIKFTL